MCSPPLLFQVRHMVRIWREAPAECADGVNGRNYDKLRAQRSVCDSVLRERAKREKSSKFAFFYHTIRYTKITQPIQKSTLKKDKNQLGSNLRSIALKMDVTSIQQVTRKQRPMRIQINLKRRLWSPYPPDPHDDVHVLAKVGTLRERERLPIKNRGKKRGIQLSLRHYR
jgi:hypothetical protein